MQDDESHVTQVGNSPEIRRNADIRAEAEFKALRVEVSDLRANQSRLRTRVVMLEEEASSLDKKISYGKGLIIGMLITTGGIGVLLADKLKTILSFVGK